MPFTRLTPFLLVGYAAVHVWWAVTGVPRFDSFGESFIPGAWTPVAIAVAAFAANLLLHHETLRWTGVVLGWLAGTGMVLYSFMFALDLVRMLFGEFAASDWTGFLIRGFGVGCGVLTVMGTVAAQRRARGACSHCGRLPTAHPGAPRTDPAPWWAFLGAYGAFAGAATRFAAELMTGFSWEPAESTAHVVFLIAYAAAGVLLPLAMAHRWGRIWPRWVVPLAGRNVPRWIVLVPAFMVGGGLTGYFGMVGGTHMILGHSYPGFPWWWTLMVIPGYTLWGVGLLVAAVSYLATTKPPCSRMSPVASAARQPLDQVGLDL